MTPKPRTTRDVLRRFVQNDPLALGIRVTKEIDDSKKIERLLKLIKGPE